MTEQPSLPADSSLTLQPRAASRFEPAASLQEGASLADPGLTWNALLARLERPHFDFAAENPVFPAAASQAQEEFVPEGVAPQLSAVSLGVTGRDPAAPAGQLPSAAGSPSSSLHVAPVWQAGDRGEVPHSGHAALSARRSGEEEQVPDRTSGDARHTRVDANGLAEELTPADQEAVRMQLNETKARSAPSMVSEMHPTAEFAVPAIAHDRNRLPVDPASDGAQARVMPARAFSPATPPDVAELQPGATSAVSSNSLADSNSTIPEGRKHPTKDPGALYEGARMVADPTRESSGQMKTFEPNGVDMAWSTPKAEVRGAEHGRLGVSATDDASVRLPLPQSASQVASTGDQPAFANHEPIRHTSLASPAYGQPTRGDIANPAYAQQAADTQQRTPRSTDSPRSEHSRLDQELSDRKAVEPHSSGEFSHSVPVVPDQEPASVERAVAKPEDHSRQRVAGPTTSTAMQPAAASLATHERPMAGPRATASSLVDSNVLSVTPHNRKVGQDNASVRADVAVPLQPDHISALAASGKDSLRREHSRLDQELSDRKAVEPRSSREFSHSVPAVPDQEPASVERAVAKPEEHSRQRVAGPATSTAMQPAAASLATHERPMAGPRATTSSLMDSNALSVTPHNRKVGQDNASVRADVAVSLQHDRIAPLAVNGAEKRENVDERRVNAAPVSPPGLVADPGPKRQGVSVWPLLPSPAKPSPELRGDAAEAARQAASHAPEFNIRIDRIQIGPDRTSPRRAPFRRAQTRFSIANYRAAD